MERRFAVHARAHRQALTAVVALVLAGTPVNAIAAPKGRAAKTQFDKGVVAYGKSDFVTASLAFGKSYALEADVEILFAWAQAERKQGNCDKASELYAKLLASKLPAENKVVVQGQLDECKRILEDEQNKESAAERVRVDQARAHQPRDEAYKPPSRPLPPSSAPLSSPPPSSAPSSSAPPSSAPAPQSSPPTDSLDGSARASTDVSIHTSAAEPSPWYKDPAGDVLPGLGLAGVAFGGVMLMSASAASSDAKSAPTYDQFKALDDKAKSRGTIGVIAAGAGAALIIGGVIRYATRSTSTESSTVTGWLDAHSSGIAFAGTW